MKKEKIKYLVLWLLLVVVILIVGNLSPKNELEKVDNQEIQKQEIQNQIIKDMTQTTPSPKPLEDEYLKGLWLSYIDLEVPESEFKENFEDIVSKAKLVGTNALFVHVRPFCDALYKSSYFPWSHILTGTQGKEPSFDPLEYMIKISHENGMEFHAWLNPLRVSNGYSPPNISSDNPYSLLKESHPYYFIETDKGIILNPAYNEVKQLIANGVAEIAENYDVDGVHIDDYFYPADIESQDSLAYDAYKEVTENPISLSEWRMANIDSMVSLIYRTIKNIDGNIVFGISPQANLANNKELCANVTQWCAVKGYADYICPQIYFSYENKALAFLDSLETWKKLVKHDSLKFYVGLALYKAGTDSDGGTWLDKNDIIKSQIDDCLNIGTDGYILYDSKALRSEIVKDEIKNITSE